MFTASRDPGWRKPAPRLGLPIHAFAWTPEDATRPVSLARRSISIRPDGYVALADPDGDPERLGRYFTSRGLSATGVRDSRQLAFPS